MADHKTARVCLNCRHTWSWHFDYDESVDRFVGHGCEYWSGCKCKKWEQIEEAIKGE